MLYQLPLNLSLALIFLDLVLIVLVIQSSKWEKLRTTTRIVAFLVFCGFSVFKWIGTTPTFLASSPNELVFKSNDEIGKLYFARHGDGGVFVFWEEKITGKEGGVTFEMDGIYPKGLLIFKEIDQKLLEFRPDLKLEGNTWKPIPVEINYSEFQPISKEGELAFRRHRKVAWANYASQAASLMFLVSFLSSSFKRQSKIS